MLHEEVKVIDEARQGEALMLENKTGNKKLYLESYGCQMNFSDSEIVASILAESQYHPTQDIEKANLILLRRILML